MVEQETQPWSQTLSSCSQLTLRNETELLIRKMNRRREEQEGSCRDMPGATNLSSFMFVHDTQSHTHLQTLHGVVLFFRLKPNELLYPRVCIIPVSGSRPHVNCTSSSGTLCSVLQVIAYQSFPSQKPAELFVTVKVCTLNVPHS